MNVLQLRYQQKISILLGNIAFMRWFWVLHFAACNPLDLSNDGFPCKYLFPWCSILHRTGQNISFSKSLPFGQKLFHVHFHHSCLLSLSIFLHCSQGWQQRCRPTAAHPRGRLAIHKEEERAFKVFKVFKVSHTACQGEDKGNEEDWGEDWGGGGDLRLEHVSPVDNWKIERYDKLWTNRKVMIAPGTGVVTSSHWGALPFHRLPSIHASGSGLQRELLYTICCCCKKQC